MERFVDVVTEVLHLEMPTVDERPLADRFAELGISPVVVKKINADDTGHLVNDKS